MELTISNEELRKRSLFIGVPMYGGKNDYLFASGLAGLTSELAMRGIASKTFILSNESLIPRARNYIADEFMRSGMSHLLFIDADIGFKASDVMTLLAVADPQSDYDIVCGGYSKKSVHQDATILTEDGKKTIKWICDNKYTGKVATITDGGKLTWNQVLDYSVVPSDGKQWVKMMVNGQRSLTVTCDHEIAVVDDVLRPVIHYVEAQDANGSYVVRLPNQRPGVTATENALFNEEQVACLVGSMLGDGSIDKNGYLKFGHSVAQQEYIELKANLFNGKLSGPRKCGSYKGKDYYSFTSHHRRNAQLSRLRELMYDAEFGHKRVESILPYFDDRSLAFWYMDDGTFSKNGNSYSVTFCTDSFSYSDHLALEHFLREKYGINTLVTRHLDTYRLHVVASSHDVFFNTIAKYIIPSMEYKMPEQYRGGEKHQYDTKMLDFCARPLKIIPTETDSDQYDICVDENHCFIADNFLVHNSISWEKIKRAVDAGVADQNPNELENYVGDFVISLAQEKTHVNLGEPIEVMEAGTGFMLIQRKAFERVADKFPAYLYRPDHGRSQHFDGSRKIMNYFHCDIDYGSTDQDMWDLLKDAAEGADVAADATNLLERKKQASLRYLSEDYWFCHRASDSGSKIWLLPWLRLQHVGMHVYGGDIAKMAALGVSLTYDPSDKVQK